MGSKVDPRSWDPKWIRDHGIQSGSKIMGSKVDLELFSKLFERQVDKYKPDV